MTNPFTDDDLEQLKDDLQTPEFTSGQRIRLQSLLVRLETAEKSLKWLKGFVEIAEEALKVHQLGGQTIVEAGLMEHRTRLRIDEVKRDLEAWDKASGKQRANREY